MRVLLADDHPEVRSALRLVLEQAAGLTVVGEAADVARLLELAREVHPDLVLLDWELAGAAPKGRSMGGDCLLTDLRACCRGVIVVALSGQPEASRAALAAGADAFVSKGDPPENLLNMLRGITARQQS